MSNESLQSDNSAEQEPIILVVDDQAEMRSIISDLINGEKLGRALEAGSRLEVRRILDQLKEQGLKPTMVCLDLHLIGESGFGVMGEPELKGVPVLVTSVLSDPINREAAQSLNLVAYRPRPFDITELTLDISRTVKRKKDE